MLSDMFKHQPLCCPKQNRVCSVCGASDWEKHTLTYPGSNHRLHLGIVEPKVIRQFMVKRNNTNNRGLLIRGCRRCWTSFTSAGVLCRYFFNSSHPVPDSAGKLFLVDRKRQSGDWGRQRRRRGRSALIDRGKGDKAKLRSVKFPAKITFPSLRLSFKEPMQAISLQFPPPTAPILHYSLQQFLWTAGFLQHEDNKQA